MSDRPKDLTPQSVLAFIREQTAANVKRMQFREKWDADTRARAEAAQAAVFGVLDTLAPREQHVIEHDPDNGCTRCPFAAISEDYGEPGFFWCNAIDSDMYERANPAPEWCPLRTRDVLVKRPR